jgi:hypothetical protein
LDQGKASTAEPIVGAIFRDNHKSASGVAVVGVLVIRTALLINLA